MAAPKQNKFNNKFQVTHPKKAYKLYLLGATDEEVANFFEVNRDTIKNWAKKNQDFATARSEGKLIADAEVANRLYKRATGYTIKKQKVLSNGDVVEYKEELPPETRAIEYWLTCRQRDKWGVKNKLELSGNAENPLAFLLADVATEAENASPLPKDNINA